MNIKIGPIEVSGLGAFAEALFKAITIDVAQSTIASPHSI
jgi:hypothetical protein